MIHILGSLFLAGDLPEKPKASEPVAGQCSKALPMVKTNTAPCDGILLPTSWAADYEKIKVWADTIAAQHRLDTKLYQLKIEALQKEVELISKPKPFWERPIVWATTGVILGSATVVAGGYAIGMAGGSQ